MAKLRDVFGFTAEQDAKEGESFDRELQEQRKKNRLMEKELREKTLRKEARARVKAIKKKEKEQRQAVEKAEKDRQKEKKNRLKVSEQHAIQFHSLHTAALWLSHTLAVPSNSMTSYCAMSLPNLKCVKMVMTFATACFCALHAHQMCSGLLAAVLH